MSRNTPSFERIDYLLRTNKHIERKLVFDILDGVAQQLDFKTHWYLGFGSMWFGDFKLAHRRLGIDKMISMERKDHASRAKFNRPFAGVNVQPGESSTIIAGLPADAWDKPLVAWLDYDGYLNEDVVNDIELLLSRARPNSAIIVTVNGARGTYRVKKQSGVLTREETSVGVVETFTGKGSVSEKYDPKPNGAGNYIDVKEAEFPEFLTEAISVFMQHRVVSLAREVDGQRLKFVPLYRLHHCDGADMVTVGGALVTEEGEAAWRDCVARHPLLTDDVGEVAYCRLDLVPVTVKEKIALDECLPDQGNGAQFLEAAKAVGVALSDEEMTKYRKFYRHFPVFVETTM